MVRYFTWGEVKMNKGQKLGIYVKNDKDKIVVISVNENDSIATLKATVKQELGIGDDKNIEIAFNGNILESEDEETSLPNKISDYEIENSNSIDTFILTKQELDFENNADNDNLDEDDTNKDDKSNLHQNLNTSELGKSANDEKNSNLINVDLQKENNTEVDINYISSKVDLNLISNEDNKNKSNELNQNPNENKLNKNPKEDENIMQRKEDNKEIINTQNKIKININSEKYNENKSAKLNPEHNINANKLHKKANDKTNLNLINNEINSQIDNDLQENIINKEINKKDEITENEKELCYEVEKSKVLMESENKVTKREEIISFNWILFIKLLAVSVIFSAVIFVALKFIFDVTAIGTLGVFTVAPIIIFLVCVFVFKNKFRIRKEKIYNLNGTEIRRVKLLNQENLQKTEINLNNNSLDR